MSKFDHTSILVENHAQMSKTLSFCPYPSKIVLL